MSQFPDFPERTPVPEPGESPSDGPDVGREAENLRNIRVVLVDPQYPGNIGSSARAMKNMGITDLRLVFSGDPADHLNAEARKMAMYAKDVLYRAPVYESLAEAVSDCTFVVGMTRRKGKFRHATYTSREIMPRILNAAANHPAALVFGPENFGLSNEHLRSCHELAFIPAHPDFGSLNLAMSVLIVCYEVYQGFRSGMDPPSHPAAPIATAEELAGLFGHMKGVLSQVGFLEEQNPERMMTYLRRMFSRSGLSPRDVKVLRGVFRQIGWALDQEGFRVRADGSGTEEAREGPIDFSPDTKVDA